MKKRQLEEHKTFINRTIHFAQDLGVTENHDTIFSARESNIQAPRIIQESYSLMFIAPNAAQNDVILFSSLERIDTGYFNFLVKILLK